MFGPNLVCNFTSSSGVHSLLLRPFRMEEMIIVANGFSDLEVTVNTRVLFGQTKEGEQDWYERVRKEKDSVIWAIVPHIKQGINHTPIGVTGIHDIDSTSGSCTTGIIIWDKSYWNKGVAYHSHLARTLFAADYLNRATIRTWVRAHNESSLKAVQKVGYNVVGIEPRTAFRQGRYIDSLSLVWFNPERINQLFPEGLPNQYKEGVTKAQKALALARQVVELNYQE